MKKLKAKATLKFNAWRLLSDFVESGVAYGYRRAHKYADKPDEDTILQTITDAVMGEISEHVDFQDGE